MSIEKIRQWLEKTGFPLEMEAAAAFRRAGFDVKQSVTYPDSQSEKTREIDVLATQPDISGVIDVSFVVECKASPNPWIVLTSEDALSNYNRLFALGVTSNAASEVLANRWGERLSRLESYIRRPARGGYGLRQAFGKDNDPAYAAAVSVMKACRGIAEDRERIPRLAFAFPVIVVDAPLLECALADNGKDLHLVEVEESDFLFSIHIPEQVGCCVRIIRRRHLTQYTTWAKRLADDIAFELQDEEDRIMKRVAR